MRDSYIDSRVDSFIPKKFLWFSYVRLFGEIIHSPYPIERNVYFVIKKFRIVDREQLLSFHRTNIFELYIRTWHSERKRLNFSL